MNKFILGLLIVAFSFSAVAQTPYAVRLEQRNALNSAWLFKTVAAPTGDGVFGFDQSTNLPVYYELGSGLSVVSGELTVSGAVGEKGDKGDKGDTGAQGEQGIQGEKGEDGVSIDIQLPVSRTLNSDFVISSSRAAIATYTVKSTISTTLLISSASATAYLDYSTNGGASWVTVSDSGAGKDGVSVTIGEVLKGRHVISGTIPAGASVRIRSEVTGSGTGVMEYVRGQEVLL